MLKKLIGTPLIPEDRELFHHQGVQPFKKSICLTILDFSGHIFFIILKYQRGLFFVEKEIQKKRIKQHRKSN